MLQHLLRTLAFVLCGLLGCSATALADTAKLSTSGAVSLPPPQPQSNDNKPQCSPLNNDPRCRPESKPHYYPSYTRPRPVIINQLPPEPAIEIDSLKDNWEGCRQAKLGAIRARHSGKLDQANNLDEWLWKNCRSYSEELRQLEQDDM